MHYSVVLGIFLIASDSCFVTSVDANSFTTFGNSRGEKSCSPKGKQGTLWCIAQCLELEGSTSSNKCKYYPDCTGCMKLDPNSPIALEGKKMHFSFKPQATKYCGKKFLVGAPIPFTHEHMQYICGITDKSLKTWSPKDADEIKCVISKLPAAWHKLGKIGLLAYKSNCLNKFKMCEAEPPRILDQNFLPIVPMAKNISLGSYDGRCAAIRFQIKDKNVTNLELEEISCESTVAHFCEAR